MAEIFDLLQKTKYDLLQMSCPPNERDPTKRVTINESMKQDIRLAQLCEDAKEAIKDKFQKITSEGVED